MKYNEKGQELPDDTPIEIPAGMRRPETLHEMMKRYVRSEAFRQKAEEAGVDTEEEANDFDVDDEEDDRLQRFISRHELSAMAADELRDLMGRQEFDKLREQQLAAYSEFQNGSVKASEGNSSAGRVGKEIKAGVKSESGAVEGNREKASGVDESKGS